MTEAQANSRSSFEQAGLAGVLRANLLAVQPNQRHYSWTPLYVERLFTDLSKAILDGETTYFLGTIVTIPRPDGTLEVVDGQQRLATTAILLAAMRDYLKDKDPLIYESINNDYLMGIDRVNRARVPRLKLNVDDNDLFAWIIATNGSSKPEGKKYSNELMMKAYELAQRHVKKIVATLNPVDHGDEINGWLTFLENVATVVLVKSPNGANAYKMFETLNDRGLKTTQADLIKNHLFGKANNRLPEVQARWSAMVSQLESITEDDITVTFLRQCLTAIRGFVRQSEVFDKTVDLVKSEQGAITFANNLETASITYVAINSASHEKWNGHPTTTRKSIEVLSMFDTKPFRPLLIAIGERMTPAECDKSLQFLVALNVRLIILAGTRTVWVEELIGSVANQIYKNEITTAREMKEALVKITPGDNEFEQGFASARVSKAAFARYYLRSLEMVAKGEQNPWFIPQDDQTVINLEHILPKKPLGNFPLFTSEEVDLYVNRLGNQCLMQASQNSHAMSASFADKAPVYAQSPYLWTNHLPGFVDWSAAVIVERQEQMAKLAVKAWKV